jgi:PAS domain S-box-containing protein
MRESRQRRERAAGARPFPAPNRQRDERPIPDGGQLVEQFDEPFERISEAFLAVDAEDVITSLNDAAAAMLSADREELVGESLAAHAPDSLLVARCQEARERGEEVTIEGHDDALGLWLDGTAHPVEGGVSAFVRDITEQKRLREELQASERALERLHDIATDPTLTTEGKIERMLEVGADRLNTTYGLLTRIEDGTQTIARAAGADETIQPGATTPLSMAYCRHTIEGEEPLAVDDAGAEGWAEDPAYEQFGFDCYLGATIRVGAQQYGTVCFIDPEPRETAFTERDRTFAELLTNWIHYLLEQQEYERELEHQQAFTDSLINSLPDPLYAFNDDGFIRWNDRLEAVTGYDADTLAELDPADLIVDPDRDRFGDLVERAQTGEQASVEASIATADGDAVPYELSYAPLRDETGEVTGIVGTGRDVTEQKAHQDRLSGLLDTTQSLMNVREPEDVAQIAVEAARDLLGFDISVFRLYDGDAGTLEPAAATGEALETLGDRPVYEVGSGHPGEVFASGEPRIVDDFDGAAHDLGPIRSAMYYPVGVRGTMSVCSTEPDAFDETDEQMLALLATNAAAACTRAKREQEIREARAHTERVLDRVNGLIENTIEVLVEATTREEVETGVVAELAATEPYTFAWIGRPDIATDTLAPRVWDGEADLSVADQSFALDGDGPIGRAYTEGRPQVLDAATAGDAWAEIAGEAAGALVAVPLAYRDTTYGVLAVFADGPGAFDERERVVLDALGRAVANAINAVERGRILDATEIIELEFAVSEPDLLFNRLAARSGGRIESAGTEYRADGSVRIYLSATGVDPEEFVALAREDEDTESVTCIVEHEDECLVEVVVAESLLATLSEYGAVPQGVVAEDGTSRFTVELPYEAEARELFELVEDRYPATELLGYHERERPVETRQDFRAAISDTLTDRQETALRTAYLGGFFAWPREVDGNELAAAMDISRPTYHQHLRAAQAKVFAELFD